MTTPLPARLLRSLPDADAGRARLGALAAGREEYLLPVGCYPGPVDGLPRVTAGAEVLFTGRFEDARLLRLAHTPQTRADALARLAGAGYTDADLAYLLEQGVLRAVTPGGECAALVRLRLVLAGRFGRFADAEELVPVVRTATGAEVPVRPVVWGALCAPAAVDLPTWLAETTIDEDAHAAAAADVAGSLPHLLASGAAYLAPVRGVTPG